MKRILIVDDERPLLRALGAHIEARGYEVDLVETGEAALSRGATSVHDAAIVDLGLPGIEGLEVVHGLRGWTSIPIIVLSARHQDSQKIMALDAGADDYVTKPFSMGELLARLRAALRRAKPGEEVLPVVETPDFRIDLSSKRALDAQGAEIRLTPTQWHLVEILVRNPDRLVSQRQLLEEVWGQSYVNQTNYLRQFMAQLRHKFEPDPAHPRYFLTEPGMGIRFLPNPDFDEELVANKCVKAGRSPKARTLNPGKVPVGRPVERSAMFESPEPVVEATSELLTEMFGLRACWFESFPFDAQLPRIEPGRIVLPAAEPGLESWTYGAGVELPVRFRGLTIGRFVLVPAEPTTGVGFSPAGRAEAISLADAVGLEVAAALLNETAADRARG